MAVRCDLGGRVLAPCASGGKALEGELGNGVRSDVTGVRHSGLAESSEPDTSVQDATDAMGAAKRVFVSRSSPIVIPDAASHNRIVLSLEPETMRVPSGENATDETQPECPCRGLPMAVPDAASHNRIVLSPEPETMCVPSGENATDETQSECPCRGSPMAVPDAASHN